MTAVNLPKDEAARYGVGVGRVFTKPDGGQLASIRELVEAGKVTPHVGTVLPLSEVGQAFNLSEAGHTRGKIVLQITA